ncbi:FAD:protein FMN transferase [Tautonia plasticadhaerens]|uniref:FAD:protein FMN transferase n=1 Tax=Tautonia plasticadhaerens TaxID=2527974 RepID=A0A518H593_9BACT|nr:FAD:protein FMN transferase [Tautonia plasticadhaerens]QDV36009.1 Thiamine biosynthesis lipoprotein ApbE precursor [Tautonia plasticadhaerens]
MAAVCLAALWGWAADAPAGEGPDRFEFRETHMGSEFKLVVYCNDEALASRAARAAFDRVAGLDATLSDYKVDSELMRLSDRAGGPPVAVSDDLFEVLRRSRELSERTGGAFDVTINPVVKLWRRARRDGTLPPRDRLDEALSRVGWEKLVLDPGARTVRLTLEGMRLDVGGIAKGYASDAALAEVRRLGITRALVAGAGDVVAGDPPPGRDGWTVGIAPLDPARRPGRFLSLSNAAVSTSGDAERYVEIDGVRYSHIVDPRSGLGLTGRSSVTVVAPDGTTSDGLATALSVLGPDRGLALAEEAEGVEALIVSAAGDGDGDRTTVRATGGFGAMLGEGPGASEPGTVPTLGGPEP